MEYRINQTIAAHRREMGLTQEQLGVQLGVSGQAVSKWEKGESMPDILLLPDLADIFGITVDELLGHKHDIAHDVMAEFCALARREGRTKTLLDALGALFNDVGINYGGVNTEFAPDEIRVSDDEGMGFILSGNSVQEKLRTLSAADTEYFLQPLTDGRVLSVLRHTFLDRAVTKDELCTTTEIDEDTMDSLLLTLMKRNILCFDTDPTGKRGYLHTHNMVGVYMILAGCAHTDFGGNLRGNLWMTRLTG